MTPKQIADALLTIGYGKVASKLHQIDRLLYYDAEVSDQIDTERTAEQIAEIITDLFLRIEPLKAE